MSRGNGASSPVRSPANRPLFSSRLRYLVYICLPVALNRGIFLPRTPLRLLSPATPPPSPIPTAEPNTEVSLGSRPRFSLTLPTTNHSSFHRKLFKTLCPPSHQLKGLTTLPSPTPYLIITFLLEGVSYYMCGSWARELY